MEMLVVADEISPDSCRLWDVQTGQKLDKDVFRRDLGNLADRGKQLSEPVVAGRRSPLHEIM